MNKKRMPVNETTPNASTESWEETGAMVYVALTIATFSAVTMCCAWALTRHPSIRYWCRPTATYTTLDEDSVQLKAQTSDSPTNVDIEDVERKAAAAAAAAVADAVAEPEAGLTAEAVAESDDGPQDAFTIDEVSSSSEENDDNDVDMYV